MGFWISWVSSCERDYTGWFGKVKIFLRQSRKRGAARRDPLLHQLNRLLHDINPRGDLGLDKAFHARHSTRFPGSVKKKSASISRN